jgi:Bacterial extracellular solute-binding proteins, family 5 Middle
VVFTIERAVDARTGSYWRGRLLLIAGASEYGEQKASTISGLETPDDYTVKMTLQSPDSTWLLTLGDFAGMGILPEHVLRDVAPDKIKQHAFSLNPNVSAGAFQFSKYETDQYLEIRRNDSYGGGAPPQLQDVGIALALRQVEGAEYIRKRNTDHDFEIAFVGHVPPVARPDSPASLSSESIAKRMRSPCGSASATRASSRHLQKVER